MDEAWDHLLERMADRSSLHYMTRLTDFLAALNIRTSYEEQEKARAEINADIVEVAGGGYVSVLSVYHELHCLVRQSHIKGCLIYGYALMSMSRMHSEETSITRTTMQMRPIPRRNIILFI